MRNKILYLLTVVSFLVSSLHAQNRIQLTTEKEAQEFQKPRPVHAAEYLERFYKATGFNPETAEPITPSLKKAAFNFTVGTPVKWKAQDFNTNSYYDVPSTCRVVGQNCYIFVEDAIWGSSVNETGVTAVQQAFDYQTPSGSINPSKGIFQNNVDVFGNPPNVDGDPKIILLILDIKDTYDGQPGSGYIAGYFGSVNEYPKTQYTGSNEAEIYYLDGTQTNLTTESGLTDAMSTTAHEFQHMIHFNYIKTYTNFFNECWSLSAEIINGYGVYSQSRYINESNRWLFTWRSGTDESLNDYSRAARFGLYLYEQFGTSIFRNYLQGGRDGVSGLNSALAAIGSTRTLASILPDWFIANFLNDKNTKAEWGYSYPNLTQMAARVHANPNVTYSDKIYNHAVQYISFTNGSNLSINFDNKNDQYLKVKVIKYGEGIIEIEDVTPKTDYTVPGFGSTVTKVVFILYYVDSRPLTGEGPFNYSYTATGEFESNVQELAYDNTEPVGYINLDDGDSIAVRFNAMSGFKLDSIRVAIRNIAPIEGRVLEYLGYTAQLGGKNYATFTATSRLSATPPVIDETGTYPYQQPYPNWTTVDLRSFNISADKEFVVEFPYKDPYPETNNRILATYKPSTGEEHTILYDNETAHWSYSGVSGKPDYSWVGLIRAYVSLVTDVKEVIELLPSVYSLGQNYPNPFNPSTIISYQLPKAGNVQVKIFDALGREVRSLINEEKNAGKHNIMWDSRDNYGSKVSSGVYFYTITTGDFVETKKMVLLK